MENVGAKLTRKLNLAVGDAVLDTHEDHALTAIDAINEATGKISRMDRLCLILAVTDALGSVHAARRNFHRRLEDAYDKLEKLTELSR